MIISQSHEDYIVLRIIIMREEIGGNEKQKKLRKGRILNESINEGMHAQRRGGEGGKAKGRKKGMVSGRKGEKSGLRKENQLQLALWTGLSICLLGVVLFLSVYFFMSQHHNLVIRGLARSLAHQVSRMTCYITCPAGKSTCPGLF